MESLVEDLTRGNVTEVKVVLASVVMALAVYQAALIAVAYGRLRPSFLAPAPASLAHRAIGGTLVVLLVVVAAMCLSYFEVEDGTEAIHAVAAVALLAVLALKVAVVRLGLGMGRYLPVLGIAVLTLIAITWITSAGDFLGVAG